MDAIDKINAILSIKGMSGADLERKIGVSNSVYSQWNTKKAKPSNKSLAKVAEALGVDISEIIPDKKIEPAAVSGSELDEKSLIRAKKLSEATPDIQGLVDAILNDGSYRPKVVDKVVEVVCPLSGRVERIEQRYFVHDGKRIPDKNSGCDNCYACYECDSCRIRVMESVR
jgi:transcriptional regulator with XRE-family HTH domain